MSFWVSLVQVSRGQGRGVQTLVRRGHGDRADQGPGTLQYDTYFKEDQSECFVIERSRDSEGSSSTPRTLATSTDAILATVSVVHGELLVS